MFTARFSMKALHFAMLGAGFWAEYQLAAWGELKGVRWVAVYNHTRGQAEALAQKFNVPAVYDGAEEMFRRERLDFVDIITAVDTHHRFVQLAARHKVAAICQKPKAPSLVEAEKMVRACRRAGVAFAVHENWRWQTPIQALSEVLGPFDGVLLAPFFETGGRHTINDVHYLAEGDWLIPVSETQFARDVTFGYRRSNLREWVAEKTGGRAAANDVASISIEAIRIGGPQKVWDELMGLAFPERGVAAKSRRGPLHEQTTCHRAQSGRESLPLSPRVGVADRDPGSCPGASAVHHCQGRNHLERRRDAGPAGSARDGAGTDSSRSPALAARRGEPLAGADLRFVPREPRRAERIIRNLRQAGGR